MMAYSWLRQWWRRVVEAFPWDEAPRYLLRDRVRIYDDLSLPKTRCTQGPPYPKSLWKMRRWRVFSLLTGSGKVLRTAIIDRVCCGCLLTNP
jgi:hypothetical protein